MTDKFIKIKSEYEIWDSSEFCDDKTGQCPKLDSSMGGLHCWAFNSDLDSDGSGNTLKCGKCKKHFKEVDNERKELERAKQVKESGMVVGAWVKSSYSTNAIPKKIVRVYKNGALDLVSDKGERSGGSIDHCELCPEPKRPAIPVKPLKKRSFFSRIFANTL